MNIKQISKKWDVRPSVVKLYCDEGMVQGAVPVYNGLKRDYDIPENAVKPPCHKKVAILMIDNIDLIKNEDADPYIQGLSYDTVNDCYIYFMDCGFITGYESISGKCVKNKRESIRNSLSYTTVTSRGRDFIRN